MKIPLVKLATPSKRQLLEEVLSEFREIFESGQFILGDSVKEFERQFAPLAGTEYAVGVNSGTDAIYLVLRALGIGPGDEVITAPNSFLASAAAIALVGAKPVFADVGYDYNLDPAQVEAAITPDTKAILAVHLYGQPARMDALEKIAKAKGLHLLEDAAQSLGAQFDNRPVGSFGVAGCFSLHPLKNLHVWGDGGMITTRSQTLYDALLKQRNHGLVNRDESEFFSYNSRLDTIQAIVGLQYLKLLNETTELRRRNASIYDERLSPLEGDLYRPVRTDPQAQSVYHLYVITTEKRDALAEFLKQQGIETKIHYPIPIHLQKAAAYLGYSAGDFPTTERLSKTILSLPTRESLTEAEVHSVCDQILAFYRS